MSDNPLENPEYKKLVDALRKKYNDFVALGDTENANKIAKQHQILIKNRDQYVIPAHTPSEKFWEGSVAKSYGGWATGKASLFGENADEKFNEFVGHIPLGEEAYATPPEGGLGWTGEILGSLFQPFATGKRAMTQGALAGFEGFTAPAHSTQDKLHNALMGFGLGTIGKPIGDMASALTDTSRKNVQLDDALNYSKKHLPSDAPYVDDYSYNPIPGIFGWLSDNVLVAGSIKQGRRRARLEQHADDLVGKHDKGEFLASSVRNQQIKDRGQVEKAYNTAFDYATPGNLGQAGFKTEVADLLAQLRRFGQLMPDDVLKQVKGALTVQDGDVRHWHKVRSLVRQVQEQMDEQMTPGREYVNDLVDSLDDLLNKAMKDKKGRMLLKGADSLYAQKMPKYNKIKDLRTAIKDDDPQAVMRILVGDTGESVGHLNQKLKAERIWDSLDSQGQEAVKGMAFRNAANYATDAANGQFSPSKFSEYWTKFGDRTGIMFDKKQQESIKGMQALYGMSKTVEDAASAWVGSRMIIPVIGLGGIGMDLFTPSAFGMAALSAGAVYALSRSSGGNAALRMLGKAQNVGEQLKAMQRIALAGARNPDFLNEEGKTPEEMMEVYATMGKWIDKAYEYSKNKVEGFDVNMTVPEFMKKVYDDAQKESDERAEMYRNRQRAM